MKTRKKVLNTTKDRPVSSSKPIIKMMSSKTHHKEKPPGVFQISTKNELQFKVVINNECII